MLCQVIRMYWREVVARVGLAQINQHKIQPVFHLLLLESSFVSGTSLSQAISFPMLGEWLKSSVWMAVLTKTDDSDQQELAAAIFHD